MNALDFYEAFHYYAFRKIHYLYRRKFVYYKQFCIYRSFMWVEANTYYFENFLVNTSKILYFFLNPLNSMQLCQKVFVRHGLTYFKLMESVFLVKVCISMKRKTNKREFKLVN